MQPYGISVFCDDIRFEQQNKLSLIGCYNQGLILYQPPPIVLPKFCIYVQVRFPVELQSAKKLIVYMPGEDQPFFNMDIPGDPEHFKLDSLFKDHDQEKDTKEDIQRQRAFIVPLSFSPFPIAKEGTIRVRMVHGSEILRVGALAVVHQKAPPAPPSS